MQSQLVEGLASALTQTAVPGALSWALVRKVPQVYGSSIGTDNCGQYSARASPVRHYRTASQAWAPEPAVSRNTIHRRALAASPVHAPTQRPQPSLHPGPSPACRTSRGASSACTTLGARAASAVTLCWSVSAVPGGPPRPETPMVTPVVAASWRLPPTAAAAATGVATWRRAYGAAASAASPSRAAAGAAAAAASAALEGSGAPAAAGAAAAPPPPLSFSDHQAVFEGQSTWRLLRAYGVLRVCGFKALVSNAEALLSTTRRLLGERATDGLVKSTFFAHFCAGEDVSEVQRTVDRLRAVGVGAILDYAAEDDVGPTTAAAANTNTAPNPNGGVSASEVPDEQSQGQGPAAGGAASASAAAAGGGLEVQPSARALGVVGRTYDYASEEQCDRHVEHFLSAIEMAARQPGRPAFAAIKMTALGNPALLQRASTAISLLHGLFKRFDEDGSGFIDRDEFQRQWRRLVGNGGGAGGGDAAVLSRQADETFRWLDMQGTGKVDYVSWCQRLDLRHMPMLAARIQEGGGDGAGDDNAAGSGVVGSKAVAEACLDGREVELMGALLGRLQRLVMAALQHDVRLMIDAEHTYFQPAIDHVTLRLMQEHNREGVARVLNTYQAYLVDSRGRLLRDMERARREGWVLGAKLVRGAYLHLERRRADQLGLPSPVWPSLEATHANYDACVTDLLAGMREGRAEVLLGTHNQASVEAAVGLMARLGLPPASPPGTPGVMFGQLLGMSDHLTLTLGKAGYRAYKYVPYGRVGQVMPYLLRRAAENQDIMKGSKQDLIMLRSELRRRAAAAVGLA